MNRVILVRLRQGDRKAFWIALIVFASSALLPFIGYAQVGPITPSGLNTQVSNPTTLPTNQVQYNITGGTRPGGGTNLFHSFGDFSVPTNSIANFLNVGSVDLAGNVLASGLQTSNILGRVTGGNPSAIFGTIRTEGFVNANLFMMNPAGIVFGPNAVINVGGMAHFTTADYLRLDEVGGPNAGIFHADLAQTSLLTTAPVTAFGFLGSNPAAIAVQGSQLAMTDGTGLSLIGGNRGFTYTNPDTITQASVPDGVTVTGGRLSAPNGEINLAVTASPGEFLVAGLQAAPNINGESFTSYGSVHLAPGSTINVSGTNTVSIRGGQFVLSINDAALSTAGSYGPADTISLSPGSSIVSLNAGANPGTDVQIIAGTLRLDGASVLTLVTGDGQGGNILLSGQNIVITNGGQVVTSTEGPGNGGTVSVNASESVTIEGFVPYDGASRITNPLLVNVDTGEPLIGSGLFSNSAASGTGGAVNLTAPAIRLDNGGTLMTVTSGDGAGGNILVSADTITATSASMLFSSSGLNYTTFEFAGSGKGGDITLNASQSILLSGGNLNVFALTTAFTQALSEGGGGNISLTAPDVMVLDGASLVTQTGGAGAAGSIHVSAPHLLSVSGLNADFGVGSTITSSTFGGNGGAVALNAGTVVIQEGGSVGTNSAATGNAGNINIVAGDIFVRQGLLSTGASSIGATGTINVNASGTVSISEPFDAGFPVAIYAHQEGSGARGNIHISGHDVLLTSGAEINSTAANRAQTGGSVAIDAVDSIEISNGGGVRTFGGAAGNPDITLSAPHVTLNQGLLSSRTFSSQNSGTITLSGEDISITNGSQILTATQLGASGSAGSILLQADDIAVSRGSLISSSVNSPSTTGQGGIIALEAQNGLTLTGTGTQVLAATEGIGAGGSILLASNLITVSDGAVVSAKSTGSGAAGSVTIQGTANPIQSVVIDGANSGVFTTTSGTGAGGNIVVNANSVTLQNGGALSAKTTGSNTGAVGGTITVNAEQMALNNQALVTAETNGVAPAGVVEINTGSLAINSGSQIRSSSGAATPPALPAFAAPLTGGTVTVQGQAGAGSLASSVSIDGANSGIFTGTEGTRPGGDLNISAQSVSISNGGTLSAATTGTAPSAIGGTITVNAANTVTMTGGASMTASSNGAADGGSINVTGMNGITMQNSVITTEVAPPAPNTTSAGGGNIKLTTSPAATVELVNSRISASVADGPGGGGNIVIDPQFVILQNSQILAQAVGQGGTITITTNVFLPDSVSVVSADSGSGLNGTVNIQSPLSQLGGKLSPLPKNSLEASTWINSRCRALAGGQASSFVVAGRDMLPAEPGGWLGSPVTGLTGEPVFSAHVPSFPQISIAPSREGTVSLRRMTPPGFLLQAFATDRLADCTS